MVEPLTEDYYKDSISSILNRIHSPTLLRRIYKYVQSVYINN